MRYVHSFPSNLLHPTPAALRPLTHRPPDKSIKSFSVPPPCCFPHFLFAWCVQFQRAKGQTPTILLPRPKACQSPSRPEAETYLPRSIWQCTLSTWSFSAPRVQLWWIVCFTVNMWMEVYWNSAATGRHFTDRRSLLPKTSPPWWWQQENLLKALHIVSEQNRCVLSYFKPHQRHELTRRVLVSDRT